jgi:hypothetical protein
VPALLLLVFGSTAIVPVFDFAALQFWLEPSVWVVLVADVGPLAPLAPLTPVAPVVFVSVVVVPFAPLVPPDASEFEV